MTTVSFVYISRLQTDLAFFLSNLILDGSLLLVSLGLPLDAGLGHRLGRLCQCLLHLRWQVGHHLEES